MCGPEWTIKMASMTRYCVSLKTGWISGNALSVVSPSPPNVWGTWCGCYALFLSFPFLLQVFLMVSMAQHGDLINLLGHNNRTLLAKCILH